MIGEAKGVNTVVQTCRLGLSGLAVLLVAVAGCLTPTDRPLLWMIERQPPSYVYGTIHVSDPRVLDVPRVVTDAIDACDEFYAELDLDSTWSDRAAAYFNLPEGQTLKQRLPADLYKRTGRYFRSRGLDLNSLSRCKVYAVTWLLVKSEVHPGISYGKSDGRFLDKMLYRYAESRGKVVGGIETIPEQLADKEAMPVQDQVKCLGEVLDVLEQPFGRFAARLECSVCLSYVMGVYLRGNERTIGSWSEGNPDMHDRNANMARRLVEKMRARPDHGFFLAVGAGHLPGEDGIIALLQRDGYKLRRLASRDVCVIARNDSKSSGSERGTHRLKHEAARERY